MKKQASLASLAISLLAISIPATMSADTAGTTVSSQIGSILSLFTTSGTVSINATPNASGVQTIASDTVTISTNNAAGYTLKLGETGASSTLTSGSNTIPAISGTQASPAVMTANKWGYRVDGVGGFGASATSPASNAAISSSIKFAAVPATGTPDTLKTTGSTSTNDTTAVWYGVAVNTATPSGTYTNSVTYTATTN